MKRTEHREAPPPGKTNYLLLVEAVTRLDAVMKQQLNLHTEGDEYVLDDAKLQAALTGVRLAVNALTGDMQQLLMVVNNPRVRSVLERGNSVVQ